MVTESHKDYNQPAWKLQKQNEKKILFDMVNKTFLKIKEDSNTLKRYLDVQVQFKDYSLYNAILILNQMPLAKLLKDYNSWKKNEVFVKRYPNIVKILEPVVSYNPETGKQVTGYNIKKMIDISDTDYKIEKKVVSDAKLLEALLSSCTVPKVVNNLENKVAEWREDENVLYISRGVKFSILFQELSKEISKIFLKDMESNEDINMKVFCSSYLLSKSNNIDVSNYDFTKVEKAFQLLDEKEIKKVLDSSRKVMESINEKIGDYLYYEKVKEKER